MTMIKEKRKTYSIDPEKSRDLARASIMMGEVAGKTVTRQSILDALVGCLSDKAIFNKVLSVIKKL